jgi:hypothetical protein
MFSTQAHPKNAQQNTDNKYRGINIEHLRLTIFLSSALCFFFLFYVSRPTGSMSTIVALHNEVRIITGMYKDSILIRNINSDNCVGISCSNYFILGDSFFQQILYIQQ